MSYQALYRKYRPKTLEEVVGQNHITTTLFNSIKQNKIAHAYLFAGPRGTGKTSVAHVFAREINKNAFNEVVASDLDIIEIDAASNNGIEEVRKLIENIKHLPHQGKYKVYIIDEVHMLTKGAFNALLKVLEEPPKHAVFILATTEPTRIPGTIISRTQVFNFKRIENEIIKSQLTKIFNLEKIKFEEEALNFIAKLAQGGLRDALSIADQVAAFGHNTITFNDVATFYGLVSVSNKIKLLNHAYSKETKDLLLSLNDFLENGIDIERLNWDLIHILKDYIVFKKTNDASLLEEINQQDVELLKIDINFAYASLDILMALSSSLKHSLMPREQLQISMLKLVNHNEVNNSSASQTKVSDAIKDVPKVTEERISGYKPRSVSLDDDKPKPVIENDDEIAQGYTDELDLVNLFDKMRSNSAKNKEIKNDDVKSSTTIKFEPEGSLQEPDEEINLLSEEIKAPEPNKTSKSTEKASEFQNLDPFEAYERQMVNKIVGSTPSSSSDESKKAAARKRFEELMSHFEDPIDSNKTSEITVPEPEVEVQIPVVSKEQTQELVFENDNKEVDPEIVEKTQEWLNQTQEHKVNFFDDTQTMEISKEESSIEKTENIKTNDSIFKDDEIVKNFDEVKDEEDTNHLPFEEDNNEPIEPQPRKAYQDEQFLKDKPKQENTQEKIKEKFEEKQKTSKTVHLTNEDILEVGSFYKKQLTTRTLAFKVNGYVVSSEDIINLYVQMDKKITEKRRAKWKTLEDYGGSTRYGKFVSLLSATDIVCAGDNYLLVASRDDFIVKEINMDAFNPVFFEFIEKVMKKPLYVFGINGKQFEEVKTTIKELDKINQLPPARIIPPPPHNIHNAAAKLGETLFGDLFNPS